MPAVYFLILLPTCSLFDISPASDTALSLSLLPPPPPPSFSSYLCILGHGGQSEAPVGQVEDVQHALRLGRLRVEQRAEERREDGRYRERGKNKAFKRKENTQRGINF